jgi:hypothetical protein
MSEMMAIQLQLNLEWDALLKLVDQLPPETKRQLRQHLDGQLSVPEHQDPAWEELLRASVMSVGEVMPDFSFRRDDWYGNDGR